jgi:hypothetical protein
MSSCENADARNRRGRTRAQCTAHRPGIVAATVAHVVLFFVCDNTGLIDDDDNGDNGDDDNGDNVALQLLGCLFQQPPLSPLLLLLPNVVVVLLFIVVRAILTPWLVVVTAGSSCRRFGLAAAAAAAAAVLEVSFSKSTLPSELLSLSLSLYRHSSSMLVGAAHNNDSREDTRGRVCVCVRVCVRVPPHLFLYKIGQAAQRHCVLHGAGAGERVLFQFVSCAPLDTSYGTTVHVVKSH